MLKILCHSSGSIAWSVALLYFYGSGRVDSYLSPSLSNYALIGGLLLAVLGLFNLFVKSNGNSIHISCCDQQEPHCHNQDDIKLRSHKCCEDEHDHNSELPPLVGMLFLILPLSTACWLTVDDYSSSALIRKGLFEDKQVSSLISSPAPPAYTLEQFQATTPKTPDGYFQVELIDLLFATTDPELQAIFQQVPIEICAQIATNPEAPKQQVRLYRLFITCCNADAQPVSIRAILPQSSQIWQDQQWVSARGKLRFEAGEGFPTPVLEANQLQMVNRPSNAFLNSNN